jgi:hypothetical protein
MNDQNNIKFRSPDDEHLHDTVQQPADELMEIDVERLEDVSGGSDGTAIGHN